ncbi:MAG: hypothetical protein K5683_07250, partial [Prevotella sp.]|nr:hypothetical protein [Prevotella sp.]
MQAMLSSTYQALKGSKNLFFLLLLILVASQAKAQITIGGNVYGGGEAGKVEGNGNVTIKSGTLGSFSAGGVTTGGNVYGGGNQGDLKGHTTVTLQGGDIRGGVYGGARMADVKKYTYVNIDGANQLHDLTVNRVYGGNDISGVIGAEQGGTAGSVDDLPFASVDANNGTNHVDNTFQSFIQATKERSVTAGDPAVTTQYHTFIGQMFNGGNGDYTYGTTANADGQYEVKSSDGQTVIATSETAFTAPTVAKSYMQVNGGTYGYVYAGGNAATVAEDAVISINNTSDITTATDNLNLAGMSPVTNIDPDNKVDWRLLSMGLNLSTFQTGYHFNRVFGGNNKADMAIMPTWNLQDGDIINLYSGGNAGRMTYKKGILLEIKANSDISAVNVYGGCRKADVHPLNGTSEVTSSDIQIEGYNFPAGFSARTLVRGGTITNVYGGNDISGKVYGGNAVGVYTSILGDVYGGGNGSYAYTDNADLKDDIIWGDFYYDPGSSSIESLNAHRPNAEQVSLRLKGESETNRTIIGGSVYVGGNSATLATTKENPKVELKIGSHVIADNVFLGNNGENMVDASSTGVLARYFGTVTAADQKTYDFSTLDLKNNTTTFAKYMDGCAMTIRPSVVFDNTANGDPDTYEDYTTFFGSFFGGGNVGSMIMPGKVTLNFDKQVVIFNKLVGGCNNANIPSSTYNAAYNGGVIGSSEEQAENGYQNTDGSVKDRIEINLAGVKLAPLRWKVREATIQPSVGTDLSGLSLATMDSEGIVTRATGTAQSGVTYYEYLDVNDGVCTTSGLQPTLEYNVFSRNTDKPLLYPTFNVSTLTTGTSSADDLDRRLKGANVYGACYNSGHVNGNVVINLNNTIHDRKKIFDEIEPTEHLDGNDSYTITQRHTGVILNEQAMDVSIPALAVFGAGFGTASEVWGSATVNLNKGFTFQIYAGGQQGIVGKASNLAYDAKYSTFSNLNGTIPGVAVGASGDSEDMAESVFIYGGSYKGTILGNAQANLGKGRVYNSIAGSCTANIYGHTEMYIGRGSNDDGNQGFPWVIDDVYGGNDVAGQIMGTADFKERVRTGTLPMVYGYNASTNPSPTVTQANAYVEYQQGHVRSIFGGSCGDFDYTGDTSYSPYAEFVTGKGPLFIENAFVNFSPLVNISNNNVLHVYGAGQGHKDGAYKDMMQNRSYVLVDVPQYWDTFQDTEVFGGGENGGVGMGVPKATAAANASGVEASAVIDLVQGKISAAYGGSYSQGMTRRTIVNVPKNDNGASTIVLDNIFGGAYGEDPLKPCDVYQSIVNYNSGDARVNGAIYGGNNSADRTLYTQVNINAPVKQSNGYDGYVYGAGKGEDSWAQYTEVNLNDGASVWEVYGGGNAGKVLNKESVAKWAADEQTADNTLDLTLGGDYTSEDDDNFLENVIAKTSNLYTYNDKDANDLYEDYAEKYNTNVIINKGAYVGSYAYGGGYGADAVVSGSTYVELNGGTVKKDIYAAGSSGSVEDLYKCGSTGDNGFTASTTAYVRGGTVRNVYGGGWKGAVGYHDTNTTATTNDILGETHVVIGRTVCGDDSGLDFYDGIPAVQRNAYGAGEGGVVFGTSNLTLYNGYIGYSYNADGTDDTSTDDFDEHYEEKIGDDTYDDGNGYGNNTRLKEAGNIFGSGYADYSNTDIANVTLYGGIVRNSVYGGGEIGTVGRGLSDGTVYKGGETHVAMYEGHVMHNLFGGGRGYDNLSRVSDIGTSGYIFGSTDVAVYGGEVGTEEGVADGYGNVFGGGNIGFVYSANGTKASDGFYYYNNALTEDCKVVIAPACKVTSEEIVTLNGNTYSKCQFVPAVDLNYLKNKNADSRWNQLDGTGIIIHNAVFAGGNVSSGSDQVHANAVTVFGNATATLYDIFNRDLITIGTENVGGIYGDGNLTLVDGYRELNVSNYGTDYYGMSQSITLEEYNNLSDRERAYFELKYKCKENYHSDKLGKDFTTTSTITAEEYATLGVEQSNWEQAGVCSIYAGRLLNTIQRADFCGIFGSRMVLQGARDRVPEVVDYSNYTINRVGEVSLNKSSSQAGDTGDDATHGCYFGIYNMVNYLGALTSDVDFTSTRTTDQSSDQYAAHGESYYTWKEDHIGQRSRNNGTAAHKVALASGVYLEITTEESTKDNKVWGPITGVCQLDLINVNTGLGGGYVYAKNIHGTRTSSGNDHTILSAYNLAGYGHQKAVTHKIYTYSDSDLKAMETSGNFIHNVKQIVDDCYPIGGSYTGSNASPAHYWFIKGEVYVYDQYISAYTGSASAYSESINLPLTITPAANGELVLVDVQPNLYAYYDDNQQKISDPIVVNNITYDLNEPITYWDWSLLSAADQAHFVSETYVTSEACTAGTTSIPAGTVLLPSEYESYKSATIKNASGVTVDFDEVFHKTNHISHDTGYALTFEMSNPKIWDRYYTPITGTSIGNKITTAAYNATSSKSSYLG